MSTPPTPVRKAADIVVIVLFLGGLALPLVANFFDWDPPKPGVENRLLASFPDLRPKRSVLTAFPARFESYFSDHFGFRPCLVYWHALAKIKVLGVSSSSQVALGKEGWLFFNGQKNLEDYRATEPFTPADLEQWQQILQARNQWLAARGVKYLLAIAPNKQTIYPEYLPPAINRARPESRLDQLLAHLRAHTNLTIVDLRESLLQAKARERVYFRLDTHWNERGAYRVYQQMVNALAGWFPGLQPWPRAAFTGQDCHCVGGDLARMLGLNDVLQDDDLLLIPNQPRAARPDSADVYRETRTYLPHEPLPFAMACPNPRLPRAILFGDSFAQALVPLLSEHFSRIVYFFQYTLDTDAVERERPDVVIQEIVERKLMVPIPADPGVLRTNP